MNGGDVSDRIDRAQRLAELEASSAPMIFAAVVVLAAVLLWAAFSTRWEGK